MIDIIDVGLFTVDRFGRIILWNKAMTRITGYDKQEVIGRKPGFISFQYESGKKCPENISECPFLNNGGSTNIDCRLKHKRGLYIPILKNVMMIANANGENVGAVETITDLTAIRSLKRNVEAADRQLCRSLDFLVGESPPMRKVYEAIANAAASNATVLIRGESGTGKALVAKAIHFQSGRSDKPMVVVNCSALPETLLESELFGHIKGSYTGAIKDRAGRFEEADGGTVFLDEIGDISPLIQVKLLRVLQEYIIERIGESVPRKIDIRIIAATNKDIEAMCREGKFREDLYYRIKVFSINMPSLRDRKGDIPILINHLIKRFNRETGAGITRVTNDAMEVIMKYNWPGNVRELENAIEHAFVVSKSKKIDVADLPDEIRVGQSRLRGVSKGKRPQSKLTKKELLDLLEECDWNKSEVARRLNCSHTAVWQHMKKWSIPLRRAST
ncbi:MAG: sigma 54-interacting transcriptional regulator [bacterium]